MFPHERQIFVGHWFISLNLTGRSNLFLFLRVLPKFQWLLLFFNFYWSIVAFWASLVAHMVNNLPEMQETWVWSLGREDPLEGGMATHFSILAWRIWWTEEPGMRQSMGSQGIGHDWVANSIVVLQYCLNSYCTEKWISYAAKSLQSCPTLCDPIDGSPPGSTVPGILHNPEPCLPPPSPYHPSGSSQCTSPKLPEACIEPGLAICFLCDIIHVLMPFS